MNYNAIIAVLVKKGILTHGEGEKLVEHINNKPQSTMLADAIEQISDFVSDDVPKLATEAQGRAKKVLDGVEKLADKAVADAKQEAGRIADDAKQLAAEAKDEAEKAINMAASNQPSATNQTVKKPIKK